MSSPGEKAIRHAVIGSPVGELTLVGRADGLSGVYSAGHLRRPGAALFGDRDDTAFAGARR